MIEEMEKEMIAKVIEHPITSHALLELLIERGVRLNVDHRTLTFEQRKAVLRQIVGEMEARENPQ